MIGPLPLVDDLRRISGRARKSLATVMDFQIHSRHAWDSFHLFVEQGHRLSVQSLVRGTPIDQHGLARLAPECHRVFVTAFTFRQFVSIFEAFLFRLPASPVPPQPLADKVAADLADASAEKMGA